MTKVRFAILLLALLLICGCAPEEPEIPPPAEPVPSEPPAEPVQPEEPPAPTAEPADLRILRHHPVSTFSVYYTCSGIGAGALLEALQDSLTPAEGQTMTFHGPWYSIVQMLPPEPGYRGDSLVGLWCDNYFLSADGTLYHSKLTETNLSSLLKPFSGSTVTHYGIFRNELCHLLGYWEKAILLTEPPVQYVGRPQGQIIEQTDTNCTVRLEAPEGITLQYDEVSRLEVLLDGVWYQVPEVFQRRDYSIVGMYPSLAPGEHLDVRLTTESTARYGTLMPGQYRWCSFHCVWQFTVA